MDKRVMKTRRSIHEAMTRLLAVKPIEEITVTELAEAAEINRKTVIEYEPNSHQADEYRALAQAIDQNQTFTIPTPMTQERLEEILLEYGLMDAIEDKNYHI